MARTEFTNLLKMTIKDAVRKVLHDHSGGIKMTGLIVELSSNEKIRNDPNIDLREVFASDNFDILLEGMHDVGVVEYSWDMSGKGDGPYRSKQFVYSKS